jgi:hypothetical protein
MNVESWLTNEDKQRIWKVVHGQLPESFITDNELKEFNRVLMVAALMKMNLNGKRVIH